MMVRRSLRRCVLAFLGMLFSATTVVASGPADNLRDALARMPALAAEHYAGSGSYMANFMDISAVIALAGGDRDRLLFNLRRLAVGYGVGAVDGLRTAVFTDDMERVGTELADIRYIVGRTTREAETAVWRLNAPARAVAAPGGQCVGVAEFRGPPGGLQGNPNPIHRLAGDALMRREFALLRIAVPAGR